MPRTPWIHELRWPEIETYLAAHDVVLVPIGATEQHQEDEVGGDGAFPGDDGMFFFFN